ncbi:hypothetical protein E4U49_006909 [Claviceps purpurea]|nr:hypothetical protein E4U49_006909 [Claviceps purpurea]
MVSSILMALLSGKSNGALSPESPPSPGSSPAERELPYHRFRVPPEPYTIRDLSLWASRRATLLHCLWRLKNSSRRLSKSLPLRDLGALLDHPKSKAQVRRAGSIARQVRHDKKRAINRRQRPYRIDRSTAAAATTTASPREKRHRPNK